MLYHESRLRGADSGSDCDRKALLVALESAFEKKSVKIAKILGIEIWQKSA